MSTKFAPDSYRSMYISKQEFPFLETKAHAIETDRGSFRPQKSPG
jgi:hypothetical protein